MKIDGVPYRSLWWDADEGALQIIDQRWLPHELRIQQVDTLDDYADAIVEMRVRGAPLIGATAAYGMALAMAQDPSDANLDAAWERLHETRPTAINLRWALDRCRTALRGTPVADRVDAALRLAHEIADEDVEINRAIGTHGLQIIRDIAAAKPAGQPVNILTHCNAGWIATVDFGTATSPMYQAHDAGIPIHVWVDETRPRNQGALTSWELGSHGIPHTYVTDNAGGHLMQKGMVDLVITGTDRTTRRGDVCNKIGTYLKALAARDNGVPFYVALPSPTIDWTVDDGVAEIPIEERRADEVSHIMGVLTDGSVGQVRVTPDGTPAGNPAFDVTPNRLVTGLITERGVCDATPEGLAGLFPDMAQAAE
ncbi:Methylthioribose-1-phosphate isomerase [Rhodobacteraceae bacterium THAF1]|uniref:S-methyl-5-thioribose-1-phosphate isomerase n=1 Tax=Palleronia sp. THAF1 TaxID=2587842 RepID=UPI000F3ECA38|nr:S-methyl-5-thioribose-1-phosphate isomerase [Palleronia sp. THAF1]QFU07250.1 Methylthioribose-1-phosphate isomerase [Palleronia sp. THAF1]VDC20838.1 Methylthioribose-1-phosphate isomerase [Rhodobacteraceae bacterium THAF1]